MRRKPLNKRLKRDFIENIGRYLAIALMFVSTIALVSAFLVLGDSVKYTLDKGAREGKLEDGQFITKKELTQEQIALVEQCDVEVYSNYYVNVELDERTTLRIFPERTEVNVAALVTGRLPEKEAEIAIDRVFAERNGIEVGELLEGLLVTGYIALPDFTSLYEDNNDLMLNTQTFCSY